MSSRADSPGLVAKQCLKLSLAREGLFLVAAEKMRQIQEQICQDGCRFCWWRPFHNESGRPDEVDLSITNKMCHSCCGPGR